MSFPSPGSGSTSRRRFQPIDTLISSLKIVERETPTNPPPAPNDPVKPTPTPSVAAGPSSPRHSRDSELSSNGSRNSAAGGGSHNALSPVPRPPPGAPNGRRAYGQSLVSAPASFNSTVVAASRSLGPINQDVPDEDDHRTGNSFVKEWGYEDDEMRRLFEEARMAMELEAEHTRLAGIEERNTPATAAHVHSPTQHEGGQPGLDTTDKFHRVGKEEIRGQVVQPEGLTKSPGRT